MAVVWTTFPQMNEEDLEKFKFPKDLDDAKELGNILSRYKEQYFVQVFKLDIVTKQLRCTILFLTGVQWFCLCLHISADICHPRLNISLHPVRISVSLPPGIVCSVFLFCHRGLLLLPALLLGGQETGETLST